MNFKEMLVSERETLGLSDGKNLAGLALSGGGVRAAMVSRGLLGAFKKRGKLLQKFAYVSAVSGGAYAASEMLEDLYGQAPLSDKFEAPGYSKRAALVTLCVEIATRFFFLLDVALLLLLGSLVWIEAKRQSYWALSQGMLWSSIGVFALAVVLRQSVAKYLVRMPHKRSALRRYRHYPRLVTSLVLIFWLYRAGVSFLIYNSAAVLNLTGWHLIGFGVIAGVVLLAMLLWFRSLRKSWSFQEPLFAYYRLHLKQRFAKNDGCFGDFIKPNMPFPIFNATANDEKHILPFELTPIACGSPLREYVATKSLPMETTLADAMAISGAAIELVNHEWNWADLLSIFSGGTGCWFPHFARKLTIKDNCRLAMKMFTNLPSNDILRVYDGGFSDNLGIVALLRRQVKLIVCVDAAYDPGFLFEDLRRVCSFAASEGIAVIDAEPVQKLMHELRFEGDNLRFVKLDVRYFDSDELASIIYIKLAARAGQCIASKRTFSAFPQITTDDQRLTSDQLKDLFTLGGRLAAECMSEVEAHFSEVAKLAAEKSCSRSAP